MEETKQQEVEQQARQVDAQQAPMHKRPATGFEEMGNIDFFRLCYGSLAEKGLIKGRVRRLFEELLFRGTRADAKAIHANQTLDRFVMSDETGELARTWFRFAGAPEDQIEDLVKTLVPAPAETKDSPKDDAEEVVPEG